MLRKLIATGLAGASLLAAAGPTFAFSGGDWWNMFGNDLKVKVSNSDISVATSTTAQASTGSNTQKIMGGSQGGWSMFSMMGGGGSTSQPTQTMDTGNASAHAESTVDVATTLVPLCNCLDFDGDVKVGVRNTGLMVLSDTMAGAFTGDNMQMIMPKAHAHSMESLTFGGWGGGSVQGSQDMNTGNASAHAESDTVVGYTNFGVSEE